MTVKSIYVPSLRRHFKLGRNHPRAHTPRLKLANYIRAKQLPTPPSTLDYTAQAMAALRQIYLNDQLGDCVIAGGFHVRGVTSGNALGTPVNFTADQVLQDYSAIGGYVPGDPSTDNGCDESTAINYWIQTGFPDGVKLLGSLDVDPTNPTECMTALYLAENLYFGVPMPDDWVNAQMPQSDNFVWDVAGDPDPDNGHCFNGDGYNLSGYSAQGVGIDTWGMLGLVTWAALAKYCSQSVGGELHCLVERRHHRNWAAKGPQRPRLGSPDR